ncbi:MAG: hypothetical protein OXJ37_22015 [Bryobacterales bacterium]|nr:hypothetical protein [Bryobacterales bacterium]MDE0265093.1 hypothetical protein [Bryobacterales bacterium]MDE0620618.1 hypothetical protein [Bryobacterales bacterium]
MEAAFPTRGWGLNVPPCHSFQPEYAGDGFALVVFGAVRAEGVGQAQKGRRQVRRMDRRIDVQTGRGVRDRVRVSAVTKRMAGGSRRLDARFWSQIPSLPKKTY